MLAYLGHKLAMYKKREVTYMIWMIGLGGSLGAAARFILGNFIIKRIQKVYPFPIGTWIINITGSFLLGLITQLYLANNNQRLVLLFWWSWFLWCLYNFLNFWG